MRKILAFFVVNMLMMGSFAQIQVYPADVVPEKGMKYVGSVRYALPTTTLKMTVSVSKVQDVRGYFADYAESLLGLTNIIQQNRTYYTLNSVDVEPIATPDESKIYCAYTSNADIAKLWQEESRTATDVLAAAPLNTYTIHTATLPDFFKNYADISYTQQSEAFVDTKIIDGVVTQVPASHTKTVSKSFESKAREAADAIMKSRKDQYNLVAGEQETPYSGEALAIMLSELKNWENNYMSLFAGVSLSDTIVYVLYITPDAKDISPTGAVAFYFNDSKGLNSMEGNDSDAYRFHFRHFYGKYTSRIACDYPLYGMLTRTQSPVFVTLTHNNKQVHDFGMINMYQAGSEEVIPLSPNRNVNIDEIGVVF